jgi:hypothetical protein
MKEKSFITLGQGGAASRHIGEKLLIRVQLKTKNEKERKKVLNQRRATKKPRQFQEKMIFSFQD